MTAPAEASELSDVVGPVLGPGDDGFAEEISAWNVATIHTPSIVVGASSAEDVAAAIRYAAARDLPVGVQATGHGAMEPVSSGVLITTRRLQEVTIDAQARTARVGAGVVWGTVIDAAAPHGLAPLGGSSSDVGVVGYTLGGGVGPLARTYGFAADRVIALDVATADGAIRHVDAEHEVDLFWALRGGKGNFGIVTAIEFELLPLTHLYGGGIFYSGEHVDTVLRSFQEWSRDLPETVSTSVVLLRLPDLPHLPEPLRGTFTVHLRYAYVGESQAQAQQLLAPMRAVAPAIIDQVADMPYTAIDSIHQDPRDPLPFWERGILLRELTDETVQGLLDVAGDGADVPLIMVELRLMGGQIAREPKHPNAASGRHAAYSLHTVGLNVPELAEAVPTASRAVLATASAARAEGDLVNFLGSATDPDDVLRAYPVPVRERLLRLKTQYDPTNLFTFGHAIAKRA